jgi:predicted acyl esterase
LSNGTLTVTYGGGDHTLTNPLSGGTDPNGPATDPLIGEVATPQHDQCRTDKGPAIGGYTGYSEPLPDRTSYVGLGEVKLPYDLNPPNAQAQIDARIWDLPPSGPAYLVTRGTYRIDALNGYDGPSGDIRLPLFGDHWRLAPGHKVRLDLTQVDSPFLRANNQPSSIAFGPPTLILPTREAQDQTLTGAP